MGIFSTIEKPKNYSDRISRSSGRVVFNPELLKTEKLFCGDLIVITSCDGKGFAIGTVWPSFDVPYDSLYVPASLRLTAQLEFGQKVRVIPWSGPSSPGIPSLLEVKEAETVRLIEITSMPAKPLADERTKWLCLLLREALVDLKYVTTAQVLEVAYEGKLRHFKVATISSREVEEDMSVDLEERFESLSLRPQIWTVGWDSTVLLMDERKKEQAQSTSKTEVEILTRTSVKDAYSSVGGLDRQIREIRDLLEIPLTHPELFNHFGLKPPRGILLHGPPGTGKTHLARAIASSVNASVLVINGPELSSAYHGETESRLRDVFKEAKKMSPCIVVLDEVDAIVPMREDGAGAQVEKRVVATLLTILDGMEEGGIGGKVVVIGTTNRPNAIDPALRRPGRFDREIEIGIPDAEQRLSILNVLLRDAPHLLSQEDLLAFSSRAHGYVGADLSAVVREAGTIAIKRWLANSDSGAVPDPLLNSLKLTLADLEASMPSVRPSAMRSLFFEAPPIRFSDIGGQTVVVQKLREAVEWPLLHPEAFQRLGVKPPKGVLLYGPPGCSKTILARACACESGVNFVAVKGPELLNKFVGESERAVREIFRKARAASPSIIFFDEIDALGTSRSVDESIPSPHGGVLTSLLNEMDGVQELVGVTVLAATNRPEAIDSALMRPGRLDRILYVGPPDQAAREEILKIKLGKMSVDPDIDVTDIARLTEGCSGAEIVALCQEAAILAMQKDINAPYVPQACFITAAMAVKRQIIPEVLRKFERWTKGSQG